MHYLGKMWRFLVALQLLPALESGEETLVGGQAVLEGVMMRSPHAWAIAVRKPSGEMATHSEPLERPSDKHKWMGWPVVRGVMTLGYAMSLGFRALRFSADVALEQIVPDSKGKKVEISGWIAAVNIAISVGFFIFTYKFLPLLGPFANFRSLTGATAWNRSSIARPDHYLLFRFDRSNQPLRLRHHVAQQPQRVRFI